MVPQSLCMQWPCHPRDLGKAQSLRPMSPRGADLKSRFPYNVECCPGRSCSPSCCTSWLHPLAFDSWPSAELFIYIAYAFLTSSAFSTCCIQTANCLSTPHPGFSNCAGCALTVAASSNIFNELRLSLPKGLDVCFAIHFCRWIAEPSTDRIN